VCGHPSKRGGKTISQSVYHRKQAFHNQENKQTTSKAKQNKTKQNDESGANLAGV
jgi:hypothetical protein